MTTVKYQGENINIYWFSEAEQVIINLADKYTDDITPVSRGGKNRNKKFYYNYPCAFDIETTTIKPGELDYPAEKDAPPLAFPYLFQWNIYGKVIMCRTYDEAETIFKWISKYFIADTQRRLIFYDHNANFEWHFLKSIWPVDFEKSFALDEHHPVTLILKNGLVIRDSFKMTNMSLETLTKDWSKHYFKEKEIMDYSKLRTPYTELDNNTLLYSALDVLSLSDAITHFLDAKQEPIWTKCPTSTSFIRTKLKRRIGVGVKSRTPEQKKYFKILEKQRINKAQYLLLNDIFRGGNTHANRKYTGVFLEKLAHFDITSAHPSGAVCKPEFPVGIWQPLDTGASMKTIELFERNGYCTMFKMALINPRLKKDVPVPYISISKMGIIKGFDMQYTDNGRYIGGLDAISLSIFGIEWPIIKSQYDFDDAIILNGWFSYKTYMPDIIRNFILELYAKKTELKNVAGQEIEYALAKTYINGVYGMAATRPIMPRYEFNENGIELKPDPDISEELERFQNSTSYFLPFSWGCIISTLTRVYLQKLIDAAGFDNFVYCDTDSIFMKQDPDAIKRVLDVIEKEKEDNRRCGLNLVYYDIKGKPHELGGVDREPDADFKTFGAKKYITVEDGILKCTIAGVPKKKGAEIIKTPDNFKLGLNFPGAITEKLCLWYNDSPGFNLHDQNGHVIIVRDNIAMLPCDYLLDISQDYRECLSIEGDFHWNFTEADKNVINEI